MGRESQARDAKSVTRIVELIDEGYDVLGPVGRVQEAVGFDAN
jgi:hypothetical protein